MQLVISALAAVGCIVLAAWASAWIGYWWATGKQARAVRKVDRAYPMWRMDVKSQRFADWHARQAAEIRTLSASERAKDAMEVMRRYYHDTGLRS